MFVLSSLPFTSKIEVKDAEQEFSFAVMADSHTAPYFPQRSEWLNSIFQTLLREKQPPELILHVGDVVEAGLPDEYKEFSRLVPYATQGDHETRWDSGLESCSIHIWGNLSIPLIVEASILSH